MAGIYEKNVFLNYKLLLIAGGAFCLIRYEINVGILHVYKNNNVFYLKVRIITF